MKHKTIFSGIFLIIGTSIGAGMLALPLSVADIGALPALSLLVACWLLMTLGALFILEVTLWLPPGNNLVTMAKHTLGRPGQVITWLCYLTLLYTLLCIYISGGTDVLHHYFSTLYPQSQDKLSAILFVTVFATVVYCGVKRIALLNTLLIVSKAVIFTWLLCLILPNFHAEKLIGASAGKIIRATTLMITAYGYAIVVPSLRDYYQENTRLLRRMVIIGSLIPLIGYVLWVFAILGTIPRTGSNGLIAMLHASYPTEALQHGLAVFAHSKLATHLAQIFVPICIITSFLGVSLSMTDFLADGFHWQKTDWRKPAIFALTYLPPLAILWFYPHIFVIGLSFAGLCCAVLLILLPALMTWRGRYHLGHQGAFTMMGGKPLLLSLMILSLLIIAIAFKVDVM